MALLDGPWRVCIRTGIFSERGIPEAVVQVLDGPVPAIERQQPLSVRTLGGNEVMP